MCVNSRLYCTHFSWHWRKICNVSHQLTQISKRQLDPCERYVCIVTVVYYHERYVLLWPVCIVTVVYYYKRYVLLWPVSIVTGMYYHDMCVLLWPVCIVTVVYYHERYVLLWPVCIETGVYYHDNVCITVTSVYCDVYLRSVYYCTRCCACCQVSGPSHSHVLTVVLTELRPTVSWTNINRPSRIAIVHWA